MSIMISFLILLFLWLFYFTIVLFIWHGTSKTRVIISAYFKCSVSHCCSSLWAGSLVRIPRENYFAGGAVLLTWWGLRRQNFSRTCTSEPARRLLLFTWKWNLEAILLNNERLFWSLVNTKFPIKVANCSPYFTILQVISNLETQRSYKITVNLKNLKFF